MTLGPPPRRYLMVEWSGGGGFGHYAWLLSDALGEVLDDVVLCTRTQPELATMPRHHRVRETWPRAPRKLRGRLRGAVIAAQWAWGWARVLACAARARRHGPTVVHVQATARMVEAPFLLAVRWMGCKLISTAHNAVPHDASPLQIRWQRLLYRIPHGLVTHSEAAARRIRVLAGEDCQILVVPCGPFSPIADHFSSTRVEPSRPARLAHLGMIRPYKRFDMVVDTVRAVLAERRDAVFRVVGRAGDPSAVVDSLASLRSDQVSCELVYLSIERLVQEAESADVVVLGHRSESESGIAHLALGAGTPVVGPRVGPIGELLEGVPEWTYEPDDHDGAIRAINRVLDATAQDRRAIRERARAVEDGVVPWRALASEHVAFARRLSVNAPYGAAPPKQASNTRA